jgi:hypothetical protein
VAFGLEKLSNHASSIDGIVRRGNTIFWKRSADDWLVFRSVNKPSISGCCETLKQLGVYAAFIAGLFAPNCIRAPLRPQGRLENQEIFVDY